MKLKKEITRFNWVEKCYTEDPRQTHFYPYKPIGPFPYPQLPYKAKPSKQSTRNFRNTKQIHEYLNSIVCDSILQSIVQGALIFQKSQ